jgi:hypothetical protein
VHLIQYIHIVFGQCIEGWDTGCTRCGTDPDNLLNGGARDQAIGMAETLDRLLLDLAMFILGHEREFLKILKRTYLLRFEACLCNDNSRTEVVV